MNTFHLEGKSAIITGGLGGYGLAIAGLILKRGGRVLVADIIPEKEAETTLKSRFAEALEAKTLLYTVCDVSSEAQIQAAFDFAHEKLTLADSSVDILINGAGIVGEQNWKKLFEVNIVSDFFTRRTHTLHVNIEARARPLLTHTKLIFCLLPHSYLYQVIHLRILFH